MGLTSSPCVPQMLMASPPARRYSLARSLLCSSFTMFHRRQIPVGFGNRPEPLAVVHPSSDVKTLGKLYRSTLYLATVERNRARQLELSRTERPSMNARVGHSWCDVPDRLLVSNTHDLGKGMRPVRALCPSHRRRLCHQVTARHGSIRA